MSDDDLIGFTLINTDTKTAVLYTGVSTTVNVVLVNNTGGAVGLTADADAPSTLTFYLPGDLFTSSQLSGLGVNVTGWSKPAVDTDANTLTLTCTADASWAADASLTLPITGVLTTASPAPNFSWALAPDNMTGNTPSQVNAKLAVTLPPAPGNLKLGDVLQVSLDNQGLVYCRDKSNVLVNQLVLTLKNVGETPLATGSTLSGTPQVVVSFVYGNTSGSLAPDDKSAYSAWSINANMQAQPPKAPWTPPGPPTKGKTHPEWLFAPSEGNVKLLDGVRTDSANVTFVFNQVITNTVVGHTQMLVLCTGFAKDSTKAYDDQLYVLDINKQPAPPTLGVLAFSATNPVVAVTDPSATVEIPVSWTTFGAASVSVLTSSAASGLKNVTNTPGPGPLTYGGATVTLPAPQLSEAFFMTLQALDSKGGYLGSGQYTSYLQLSYVRDPSGTTTYPTARFGSYYWMLADYVYDCAGSYVYDNAQSPLPGNGRLYTQDAASDHGPPGWQLPSVAVWQELIAIYGAGAYAALISGGVATFGANLTGQRAIGSYNYRGQGGYYWTAATNQYTQFSSTSQTVQPGVPWSAGADVAFAVRYVRPA